MAFPWRQWKDQENVRSSGDTSMSRHNWALKCVFVEPLKEGGVHPPAGTFHWLNRYSSAESERVGQKWHIVVSASLFCIFPMCSLPFHWSCAADTFLWHGACQRSSMSFAARPSEADVILKRLHVPRRSFMAPLRWHVWKGCICMVLRAVNRIVGKVTALFGSNLPWLSQPLPLTCDLILSH